jgi:hypothetical protein
VKAYDVYKALNYLGFKIQQIIPTYHARPFIVESVLRHFVTEKDQEEIMQNLSKNK